MNDLEKMKTILSILQELRKLSPEDLEVWRSNCLAVVSDDAKDFVNIAADLLEKEA